MFSRRQGKEKTEAPLRMIQTERLVLRAFDMGDAVDVFAYAKNPRVGPLAGWTPHASLEESKAVVRMFIERRGVWAVVEKKSGRVIGSVGLRKDPKRDMEDAQMLGYSLGEPWWGQGYATEAAGAALRYAFEEAGCQIVSVYHFPHNTKSKRVIKKLGFTYEGELRMATVMPDGSICNDLCYSMTREEYRKLYANNAR